MEYKHTFFVHAPLAEVASFHALSRSMGAITPPPVIVRIHRAPVVLGEGDEMAFTLWLLLLPIRWVARIQDVSPSGFTDVQVSGPYASWKHTHTFVQHNNMHTEVRDVVEASLSRNPIKWLIGAGMWLSMPVLFAYRGWKTKKLLQR
jgi:ligand-binding SRPBCC domain-containing protein